MPKPDLLEESRRQMAICNACRYCEGYCAVFPAMELRRTFTDGDLVYLANLCFDCRACLYACQFAPPHPFDVNVPKVFSEIRADTYKDYSWPGFLRPLLDRNLATIVGAMVAATIGILIALLLIGNPSRLVSVPRGVGSGSFYVIAPYAAIVGVASAIVIYGFIVFLAGANRFWRETGGRLRELISLSALWKATTDALDLRYLKGGGPGTGCWYPEEHRSQARRVYHQLVFFGFLADVVSTTLAAIWQDVLGIEPPFAIATPPVIFGIVGGVMMIVGSVGLIYLKWQSDRVPSVSRMMSMDVGFLVTLIMASTTGLFTLIFRETAAMGLLFAVHLGVVAGFFITAPYSKFAHIIYRYAALVRNGIEQRRAEQSAAAHAH